MRILLILERDNFVKDTSLVDALIESLHPLFDQVICGEYLQPTSQFLDPKKKLISLPAWIRKPLKAMKLLLYPNRWRYYIPLLRKEESVEKRCKRLKKFIQNLGQDKKVTILSRSAGGRISSLLADELGIEKLVCLGYPFKHPERSIEPERFLHLEHIKTPFLIIQGTEDEYGGKGIESVYPLSSSVRLQFVETGHDFKVLAKVWDEVIEDIRRFVTAN